MVEDLAGAVEVIVFPRVYRENASLIKPDMPLWIKGRVNFNTRDDQVKVIAEDIRSLDENNGENEERAGLYIKIPKNNGEELLRGIKGILRRFHGRSPVYLFFESTRKGIQTKEDWWVNLDSDIVEELSGILGESYVYVKQ